MKVRRAGTRPRSCSSQEVPADGGKLRLLLHLLSKHLQLLLKGFFVVVGVNIVVVWHHGRQELGTSEAEEFLKHLQISEEVKRVS